MIPIEFVPFVETTNKFNVFMKTETVRLSGNPKPLRAEPHVAGDFLG